MMRLHGFCIFYDQSRHHTSTNYRLACQTSLDNRKKMFLRRVFHSCPPRFIQKGVNKLFQKRFLNTHEYQSLEILSQYGINTPKSKVASTIEEVERYAKEIGTDVVIKAQILAGGRGKGYFLNGFKGQFTSV